MSDEPRRRWAPLDIEIMLHLHCRADRVPNQDAPAQKHVIAVFAKEGLIEASGNFAHGWSLTERGQAFVEMLCITPLPKQVYVDPRTYERLT